MEATNEVTGPSGDAAELARKLGNDYTGQDSGYMDIGGKMTLQQSRMENLSYEDGGSVPDYDNETLGQGQEGQMFRQYDSIQFAQS